jgi:hypothetical protein
MVAVHPRAPQVDAAFEGLVVRHGLALPVGANGQPPITAHELLTTFPLELAGQHRRFNRG